MIDHSARLVHRQLIGFAVVAALATAVVAVQFLQVPRLLGWGRVAVSAQLPAGGGLSANNLVMWRGTPVGLVTGVELPDRTDPRGPVTVQLQLDAAARIPVGVRARARATSAVGEFYLDLEPPRGPSGNDVLRAGAVVPPADQAVPVSAQQLLAGLDDLFRSVDPTDLTVTVDELGTTFAGAGPDLARLLDGTDALLRSAQQELGPTRSLLRDLEPVLRTQRDLGPQFVSTARSLAGITDALRQADPQLRGILAAGPGATDQVQALIRDNRNALPLLLTDLAASAQVLRVYLPHLKQTLTLLPAMFAALQSVVVADQDGNPRQFFRLNINNPPPCTVGFPTARREPSDLSAPDVRESWCKAPADSQLAVRGARNFPCPNSTARAATARGCGLSYTSRPTPTLTTYDPATGQFLGPDGRTYRIAQGRSDVRYAPEVDAVDLLRALART